MREKNYQKYLKPYIKLPVIYFIVSFTWIISSDYILYFINIPWEYTKLVAMLKGIIFISSTSLLLYFLIKKDFFTINANNEKLNKALNQYIDLFNKFPNPIFRTNINGECDYFNESWYGFTGKTYKEEIGTGWSHSIHPNDKKQALDKFNQAFLKRDNFMIRFRLEYNDRTFHWMLVYGSPFYDLDKEFSGYICSCYDIDSQIQNEEQIKQQLKEIKELNDQLERKVAERTNELSLTLERLKVEIQEKNKMQKEILESADEISDLYNNSPCGYHSLDKDGNIVKINKTELVWLGYSEEEIVNKRKFIDLVTEESKAVFNTNFPNFLKKGYINDLEFDLIRKDGSIFTVLLSATSIKGTDNKFIRSRSTMFDITELKKARQALQENSLHLEAANKELESFSYSVSHDLRAPLRAVSGFSKILYETFYPNFDDQGKELLSDIIINTGKMGKLIDDLLAFSRIGRKEISKSEIDMTELFRSVFNEIKSDLPYSKIEFNLLKLPNVLADYNLLKQVIVNLLSNAVKFSGKNEIIKIEAGSRKEENQNVYWIKDNGVGFKMKYSDKLFGVFQRLHSETEFEGTGVGLAIVQRIILKHGGKVWAESSINNGSCFFFSLPA